MVFLGAPLSRKGFRNNISGMGIDSMRVGGGRCPFLIVGGLLVICIMLLCNWWALTAENSELLRQIDEFNEQLKYSVDERDKCVTRLGDTQEESKRFKTEFSFLRVNLEQQNDGLKKRNDKLEESIMICKSELDSLKKLEATEKDELESLRIDKKTSNDIVQAIKNENKKLKEDVDKIKNEFDKMKSSTNLQQQKRPINVADLVLTKATNNAANDFIDGANTDGYNQKDFKVTDQDNAAEQM